MSLLSSEEAFDSELARLRKDAEEWRASAHRIAKVKSELYDTLNAESVANRLRAEKAEAELAEMQKTTAGSPCTCCGQLIP